MEEENTGVVNENNSQDGAKAEGNSNSIAAQTSQSTQNQTQNEDNIRQENKNFKSDVERLIQQAVDRATNKLGNDNKNLRKELEKLRKEKMSDEELRDLELKNKEADIADRELKIKDKENRLYAIKAIKEAGLDDGSSNSLELVDFVLTDNEESTKARVQAFSELVKKFVASQVDQTFKAHGRNPDSSGNSDIKNSNNLVEALGKAEAERAANSNKVLNYYLGGKN